MPIFWVSRLWNAVGARGAYHHQRRRHHNFLMDIIAFDTVFTLLRGVIIILSWSAEASRKWSIGQTGVEALCHHMYLLKEAGKSFFFLLPGVSWLARSGHRALLYWRHFVCTMFTHSLTEQRFAARWRNAIIAMIIQMRENALLVAGMGWHPPRGVRSTRTMTTLARLNHRLNGQHISPQNERRAEIFLWSVLHLEKCPASIAGRKKSPSSSGRDDRDPLPPLIGAVPTFSTGINPAHFSGLCVCLLQKGTYYEP